MSPRDAGLRRSDRLLLELNRLGRRLGAAVGAARNALTPDPAGSLAIETVDGLELGYRRGTVDLRVVRETIVGDAFFGAVPEYRPASDDVVLDIGAHIGAFAVLAARRVPRGRVLAVEASLESFNYLRMNRALNRADNLEVDHLALSDRRGIVTLYHDVGNWGHSITKRLSSRTEEVPSETLAGYLDQRRVDRCDFAKLNCEGAEFPILLSSSAETLARVRRLLVLYHTDLVAGHPAALERHLGGAGYRLRHFNQARGRGWIYAER